MDNATFNPRIEALSQAVRVSLALGGSDSTQEIVARADAFAEFLNRG